MKPDMCVRERHSRNSRGEVVRTDFVVYCRHPVFRRDDLSSWGTFAEAIAYIQAWSEFDDTIMAYRPAISVDEE